MKTNEVVITTSSSLEGWTIHEYVDTVSAHVVAGTNLFKDAFAGLSDAFGGRSRTYQRELQSLNDEALDILRSKARGLRADAVIAVRLDHDEISGGGKSMFMVTALGTAVRADHNRETTGLPNESIMTAEELKMKTQRHQMLKAIASDEITSLEDENWDWDFVMTHQIHEVAGFVLAQISAISDPTTDLAKKRYARLEPPALDYFLALPSERAQISLEQALRSNDGADAFVYKAIRDGGFLDLAAAASLLEEDELDLRKKAVQMLRYDKHAYQSADLPLIERILNTMEGAFPPIVQEITEKGSFGSTKNLLLCSCGKKRANDFQQGPGCRRDSHGFLEKEAKPASIASQLSVKLEVLRDSLRPEASVVL